MYLAAIQIQIYTLRLIVNQTTGRTIEERINFHIDRTPPSC